MFKADLGWSKGQHDGSSPLTGQGQFSQLWWILDTAHTHHCDDCKRMAANSPYTPPWTTTNPLNQTPGDGQTSCGADCTCILSYSPPGQNNPDMAAFLNLDHLSLLLQTYNHPQVRFISEFGLDEGTTRITEHDRVDALVLHDGSLIKRDKYQCFLTAENGETIQLWQYPEDIPFPPYGNWGQRFDETRRFLAEWPVAQVRWVFNAHVLRRYEQTAPDIPEWSDEEDG